MMDAILQQLAAGAVAGLVTGAMCWGAMQRDIKWLKVSLTELRTLFFKYVQESGNTNGKKGC